MSERRRLARTWAAVALWLAVAYPAGMGPATYCWMRGWVSPHAVGIAYRPVSAAFADGGRTEAAFRAYLGWWAQRADPGMRFR